jgi:hypothetical protein
MKSANKRAEVITKSAGALIALRHSAAASSSRTLFHPRALESEKKGRSRALLEETRGFQIGT